MKSIYKPILFSTEMVQANLEGRKRMTRRTQGLEIPNQDPENYIFLGWDKNIAVFKSPEEKYRDCKPKFIKGDILWVREIFQYSDDLDEPFWYKQKYIEDHISGAESRVKWKPSIHMPKEAARIFLEVTNVRCERLWDISEEDAIAEGMNPEQPATYLFAALWKRINGAESWKANPWVWVYDFKVIEKPTEWPQ